MSQTQPPTPNTGRLSVPARRTRHPRNLAPIEGAADQIAGGILDPVLERGHIYVPAVGE